jgi:lysozyme family protein
MATFDEAYAITMHAEGGYSCDPDDAGGETYKGVARRYHPNWEGWMLIEAYRDSATFEKDLANDSILQNLVKKFYKENYWNVNLLDEFDSQLLAAEMFDTGVNMGTSRAAEFLQKALNYLNKNELLYDDLVVDGRIGNKTMRALKLIIDGHEEKLLYKILNVLQADHYLEYMGKSPTQEKYTRGWFSRVDFVK